MPRTERSREMRFPPEVYLIGAQKAGTTTLAYLLNQHPRITVSRPKEPHFFSHNRDKVLDWYREMFSGPPDSVLLDASTTYSMAPLKSKEGDSWPGSRYEGVPERVFSINPHARFIYSLRDPVERTYSGYWHYVRTGSEYREFGATLRNGSTRYLDVSDYYGQLLLWLEYFPLDSFLFILFEDMKESPERTAKECFEFILGKGTDAPAVRLDGVHNRSHVNPRVARRINRASRRIAKSLTPLKPVVPKVIRSSVNNAIRNATMSGSRPSPAMEKEDRNFLVQYFYERNRNLQHLISVSLDKWQA
jgi:hypothetical protein